MYFTVEKIFLEKGWHRALAASEHSTQVLDSSGVYCWFVMYHGTFTITAAWYYTMFYHFDTCGWWHSVDIQCYACGVMPRTISYRTDISCSYMFSQKCCRSLLYTFLCTVCFISRAWKL